MTTQTSSFNRWLIVLTVMMVAVVEVLDMTIVNVSLPQMMGSFGANVDQIAWILTSYIVAAAIATPLTGFLSNRLGRKRLLLINIVGFMVSSFLCGIAVHLVDMVIFRMLQGLFGAALVPLSQVIIRETFSEEEQPKAIAVWGVGIMGGPIFGPTLGGYITEFANWRWVFFINIPICIIAFFLTRRMIQDTPIKRTPIDWLGLTLLITGIACFQIFLDKGNSEDWFSSKMITLLALTSVTSLLVFVFHSWRNPHAVLHLQLFKNRNFSVSTALLVVFGIGLFGTIILQPVMMERLMDYPITTAGKVMAMRGLTSALGMATFAVLAKNRDPRFFIMFGLIISALGTFMLSKLNLEVGMSSVVFASSIQGFGLGMFFVPLAVHALSKIPKGLADEAAGLFNFARGIGSAAGISLLTTSVTRQGQQYWGYLAAHINPFNQNLQYILQSKQLTLYNPIVIKHVTEQIAKQSSMLAFLNTFLWVSIGFMILLPVVFFLSKPSD